MEKFHLYAILAGVLLVGSFTIPAASSSYAVAQKDDSAKIPAPLTTDKEQELLAVALSDNIVQEKVGIVQGKALKNYDFNGIGFYTDDINVDQPVWKPVVHITVAEEKSIGVFLGTDNKSVERIEEIPFGRFVNTGTFASNYYTGGSTGVNGLRFTAAAPTYTTGGTTNTLTAFLINAVASNSDTGFLCDPGHFPSTYWAQMGYAWITSSKTISWADTATGCATQTTGLTYTSGTNYEFKIFVSGTTWNMFAKNLSTGASFTKPRTGVTFLTMKTSEFNTGVFFENQNTGTSWYTKYGSTSLPGTGAKFSTDNGSTWSNWQSSSTKDQKCDGTRVNSTVIANSLSAGGTATWNLQTMSGIHC